MWTTVFVCDHRQCFLICLLVFEGKLWMSLFGRLTRRQPPCDGGTRQVFKEHPWQLREVAALLPQMTARALRASRELLTWLPSWRLVFQGRCLVVTNTLGGGVLMVVGDSLQQTREMRMEAGRVRDWKRTGERGVERKDKVTPQQRCTLKRSYFPAQTDVFWDFRHFFVSG